MDKLREEIIEAEKARADLLRWKLVITATLGGVALGLSGTSGATPILLLGVPLACVYVDLLCNHMNLRIQLIAQYLRHHQQAGEDDAAIFEGYEKYVLKMDDLNKASRADRPKIKLRQSLFQSEGSVFDLERWALEYSTLALSVSVGIYGAWLLTSSLVAGTVLILFGAIGIVLSVVADQSYLWRKESIVLVKPDPSPPLGQGPSPSPVASRPI